jgi:hypothetical protein
MKKFLKSINYKVLLLNVLEISILILTIGNLIALNFADSYLQVAKNSSSIVLALALIYILDKNV